MDTTTLVDGEIDAGRRLVAALDSAGFPITAALWNYHSEGGYWRLVLASPKVSELGPSGAYAFIQRVLPEVGNAVPLQRISAVIPEVPLVTELRIFASTDPAPFIGGTYLRNAVIGDILFEQAYVYRAERIIGKTGTFELWSATPEKAHKAWTAHRCKVTVEGGFFKKIEVEGIEQPKSRGKNGINAQLIVFTNIEDDNGVTIGDVTRWVILGGRLRSVDMIARGIRVEGYRESPSSATVTA